jgi:CubicO group peptidase (beta-lactamase class C family)
VVGSGCKQQAFVRHGCCGSTPAFGALLHTSCLESAVVFPKKACGRSRQTIRVKKMKRSLAALSLVSFLLFLQPPSLVVAQHKAVDFTELESVVLTELSETNTPGAAVAVVSGDSVIFAKGFGVSNIESGAPVTPDILFRIGSVTKMFTATLLVTFAEERKIDIQKPIGELIKGLNSRLSAVTLHQLMSHTAGMTDESPSDYGSHDDSALAAYVKSLKEDHFFTEPGKIFSYSNPAYDLVGFSIEEFGGKPYADQMSEHLFRPLGMNSTTFRPTMAMTYAISQGHTATGNAKPSVIRPFVDNAAGWPDGFLFSSVNDLARFAIAFLNGGKIDGKQILMPSVIKKLSTPYVELQSRFGFENGKYGYGLFIHDYRGVRVVWHAGLIAGFGALFQMVPEQRFAVIILANRSDALLNKTAEKAMELMLPLRKKAEPGPRQSLAIGKAELVDYAGTYLNKPERAEIVAKDGKLYLKLADGEFSVTKIGSYRFSIKKQVDSLEEFVLVPNANGKIEYLHIGRHALKKVDNN